ALDAHVQKARALIERATVDVVSSQSEADLWRDHVRRTWTLPGTVIKFAWLPASLGAVLALVDELRDGGMDVELTGRAALASGLLRIDGEPGARRNVV